MAKLCCCGSVLLIMVSCFAVGQENSGGWHVYRPHQEIRVPQLSALMARTHDLSDVLLTSLDIVFHDPSICCGKDSALEDRTLASDPLSLKEIASKVRGRQLLSDGRPIMITADFLPTTPAVDISWQIVGALRDKQALLVVWNSHLYVLYGAVFDEIGNDEGSSAFMIHKLLLLDTRYSGSRREVIFNRDTDDWGKVEGMLRLSFRPQ
ncbi:MAG TPA: hypothetical protein VIX37_06165 [Candidatus Sulfotelmatobacter sp.]